jgi:CheY-like chemotaxis protein
MPLKTILIADDDTALLRALAVRLESEGYRVVTTQDAYHAFERARSLRPDLMILDINMPAGNGFSVLERMAHLGDLSGIPSLFVTGDADPDLEDRARQLGAAGLIRKPFKTQPLLDEISRALRPAAPALAA